MFMPAVDDDGTSHRYDLFGDCVATTYSSASTYLKLGFNGVPSRAGIITKSPIDGKSFRIDVRLTINKGTRSDGIAFWIGKDSTYETGPVFGRKGGEGLLIAIVTKNDVPYIGISVGDHSTFSNFNRTEELTKNIFDEQFTLRITFDQVLVVSLGKSDKFKDVFKISDYELGTESFFAVSVNNSTGYSDFKLHAIRHSTIEYPVFKDLDEKRTGGGKWVWLLFLVVIAVIAFILYKKQTRKGR